MVEEMLVSPILAIMSVFRLPGGALVNRGFCANFSQDIGPITQILPRLPKDLPLIILKKKDQVNNLKQFVVNRERVLNVLQYLCNNNPSYKANGIKIDHQRLQSFPVNDVPLELNSIVDRNDFDIDKLIVDLGPTVLENNCSANDDNIETFVEMDDNELLQIDNIKKSINFPTSDNKALNEFSTDSICSMLFPKLFPNGSGDPTTVGN